MLFFMEMTAVYIENYVTHKIKKLSKAVPLLAILGERRYSSYSFLTSALDGVSGQRHVPQGKDPRYLLHRRLGGPQSRSGHRV
jgi:hypothetical protein